MHRFSTIGRLLGLVILTLGFTLTASPAAAGQAMVSPSQRAPLPVPHTFPAGVVNTVAQPEAPLAGANDWNCRPDADKPNPVVLVHGTSGSPTTNWATYGPLLHNAGYCVFAPIYGNYPDRQWPLSMLGGLRSIPDHNAPQVADFVRQVLDVTGAEKVDLVGHSQGTLVSAEVAKYLLPGQVGAVASIAPLWEGVSGRGSLSQNLADIPGVREALGEDSFASLPQMSEGSDYLEYLRGETGTPYAPGVRYTNIVTRHEQVVEPYTSGILEAPANRSGYDVRNIVIQDDCEQNRAGHFAIVAEPRTADYVLGALDPEHAPTPRCEFVAPIIGVVGGS